MVFTYRHFTVVIGLITTVYSASSAMYYSNFSKKNGVFDNILKSVLPITENQNKKKFEWPQRISNDFHPPSTNFPTKKNNIKYPITNYPSGYYIPQLKQKHRINTEKFSEKHDIKPIFLENFNKKIKNKCFEKNILKSTIFFTEKTLQQCNKLIDKFNKKSFKLEKLKYIKQITKQASVTWNNQKVKIPMTLFTEILSSLPSKWDWCITPLSSEGKTIYPEELIKFALYTLYNHKYVKNVDAYTFRSDENIIKSLEEIGFEKQYTKPCEGRIKFTLNQKNFLKFCEEVPNTTLK